MLYSYEMWNHEYRDNTDEGFYTFLVMEAPAWAYDTVGGAYILPPKMVDHIEMVAGDQCRVRHCDVSVRISQYRPLTFDANGVAECAMGNELVSKIFLWAPLSPRR